MPNIVCVDIDGTTMDFHKALQIRLRELGHTYYPERCIDYNFNGDIGCDRNLIFDLFDDEELYRRLPFYENAKKAISMLLEQCDTVYGYTASVAAENIFNQRKELVEELGMIPRVFVNKKPVMEDADALFDDCLGVHRCWVNAGSHAKLYLINQQHNQMTEENKDDPIWNSVIRCNSLFEAVQMYLRDK
jgi:5'(3')-deoxyribonucleotidase